jgi:uncharacterized membrane protein YqjE
MLPALPPWACSHGNPLNYVQIQVQAQVQTNARAPATLDNHSRAPLKHHRPMTTESAKQHESHGALRRIAGGVLAIAQTRLELIGIELAEEKDRLLLSLFIGVAGMLLSLMALVTLTVLIAVACWDSYRWQSLAVLTAAYTLAAIGCGLNAWNRLRHAPPIFPATLAELEKDFAALKHPK